MLAYAHRGGAREGPSSTIFAMRRALESGADALETDVHATADGELVVCHDPTVDRTSNGSGSIADMTVAQIRALDCAFWFVPGEEVVPGGPPGDYPLRGRAPAERELGFPTLEEVLDAFPGVLLNIDIKQTAPAVVAYEAKLAQLLAAYGRVDDVMVGSFNDLATERFSEEAPGVATSAGTLATMAFVRAVQAGEDPSPIPHESLQVPVEVAGTTVVDERFVEVAHHRGLAVHVWTIDDPPEMERLALLGVDGIISDRPSVLAAVLARLGLTWRGPRNTRPTAKA